MPDRPPDVLARPRLVELLDSRASDRVVLVRGGTGTGKTTAVAEWVEARRDLRVPAWVVVDESLRESGRLWSSIDRAIFGTAANEPTTAADLAARIRRLPGPIALVIDDAHELGPDFEFALVRFAQQLPRSLVLVLTREVSDTRTLVHSAQTSIGTLDAHDLAFTTAEIAALLASTTTEPDPEATSIEVHRLSSGHALLTRTVIASLMDSSILPDSAALGPMVLGLVPEPLHGFALRVAVAQPVDESMATTVLEVPLDTDGLGAATALDELVRTGLGSVDPRGCFSYSAAIAPLLREHAGVVLGSAEVARIHAILTDTLSSAHAHRIAHLLADSGRYAEMWPRCIGVLLDAHIDLAPRPFSLPESDLRDSDLVTRTMCIATRSTAETVPSAEILAGVERGLRDVADSASAPDENGSRIAAGLTTLLLLWSARRLDDAATTAKSLLAVLGDGAVLEDGANRASAPVDDITGWACYAVSVVLTLTGELDRAEDALDVAAADLDEEREARRRIQRAFIHAMRGEIEVSRALLDDVDLRYRGMTELNARWLIAQAAVAVESGRPMDARDLIGRIVPVLARVPEWPYALVVLSRSYVADAPEEGLERIVTLLRRHRRQRPADRVADLLRSAMADLHLMNSDIRGAQELTSSPAPDDVATRLSAARIGLIEPRDHHIADLRELAARPGIWPRLRAQSYFLLAVHLLRRGDSAGAGDSLAHALAITRVHRIRLILALIPQCELAILANAMDSPVSLASAGRSRLDDVLVLIDLTGRERVLLAALSTARTLREIAAEEFVSVNTVKSQARSLYRKLGVRSRSEAVAEARRRGLA